MGGYPTLQRWLTLRGITAGCPGGRHTWRLPWDTREVIMGLSGRPPYVASPLGHPLWIGRRRGHSLADVGPLRGYNLSGARLSRIGRRRGSSLAGVGPLRGYNLSGARLSSNCYHEVRGGRPRGPARSLVGRFTCSSLSCLPAALPAGLRSPWLSVNATVTVTNGGGASATREV